MPGALLVVDTDVAAPRSVTRLRVDVYAEDGTWIHSRDVPRVRREDWPASFGLLSRDETKATSVLVRLRAYPESAVRDYRGETYEPRASHAPPHVPATLQELCENAPDLPPLQELTLRRGGVKLTTDSCGPGTSTGAVAAKVHVPAKGSYRFEVIRSFPDELTYATDTTLSLRRDCKSASTEIACNDNIDPDNFLSRIVTDLDAGDYVLVTGGVNSQPADLTLRWAPTAEWGPDPVPPPARPVVSRAVPDKPYPRLLDQGDDATPSSEPLPGATIDLVVRVHLLPATKGDVRVVLRGACAGTMAKLTAASASAIAANDVLTCVDDPSNLRAPADLSPGPSVAGVRSEVGSFLNDGCAAADSDEQIACVPGGDTVLGGPELDGITPTGLVSTLPVRLVGLRKFWMDRYEVTVGRYRDALRAGFRDPASDPPVANPGALDPTGQGSLTDKATYSVTPRGREAFALNAVTWGHARALCQFYGGDLPTEAQWEYAASSAGRVARTSYPWGEDGGDCSRGVVNRLIAVGDSAPCPGAASVQAVDSPESLSDVNALGIVGLAGNVSEWTLDAAARYDAPCWQAAPAIDPSCRDPNAPMRVWRGSSWAAALYATRTIEREAEPAATRLSVAGFRCVYQSPPAQRWSVR